LDDDGGLAGKGAHGREDGRAVHVRHEEVEEDKGDIGRAVGGERGERTLAAIGAGDVIAEPLDGLFECVALGGVVVDDQNAFGHDARLKEDATNRTSGASLLPER
jgi:hypothetical protein